MFPVCTCVSVVQKGNLSCSSVGLADADTGWHDHVALMKRSVHTCGAGCDALPRHTVHGGADVRRDAAAERVRDELLQPGPRRRGLPAPALLAV